MTAADFEPITPEQATVLFPGAKPSGTTYYAVDAAYGLYYAGLATMPETRKWYLAVSAAGELWIIHDRVTDYSPAMVWRSGRWRAATVSYAGHPNNLGV